MGQVVWESNSFTSFESAVTVHRGASNDNLRTCRTCEREESEEDYAARPTHSPNENNMSCRERGRAWQRIDGLNSCKAG